MANSSWFDLFPNARSHYCLLSTLNGRSYLVFLGTIVACEKTRKLVL
ncbi:unnamed protein product [Brassica oleracea]